MCSCFSLSSHRFFVDFIFEFVDKDNASVEPGTIFSALKAPPGTYPFHFENWLRRNFNQAHCGIRNTWIVETETRARIHTRTTFKTLPHHISLSPFRLVAIRNGRIQKSSEFQSKFDAIALKRRKHIIWFNRFRWSGIIPKMTGMTWKTHWIASCSLLTEYHLNWWFYWLGWPALATSVKVTVDWLWFLAQFIVCLWLNIPNLGLVYL